MSTKHNPEPWVVNGIDQYYVQSSDGTFICVCHREDAANAARIVACVNAMAGIDNPVKLRETWEAIKHLELDAYQKAAERIAQLEAALRQIEADSRELHPVITMTAYAALKGGKR